MLDEVPITAREIMTRDVAVVHPETSLLDAVKVMSARRISGMPVVDDAGTIVGMVSEGDLVRWHEGLTERQRRWLDMLADGYEVASSFLAAVRAERFKIKAVMKHGCIHVTEDTLARDIATLMYKNGIKRVPVLRGGKLIEIVARSDLVRALAQKLEDVTRDSPVPFETIDEALRHAREEAGIPTASTKRPSHPLPSKMP